MPPRDGAVATCTSMLPVRPKAVNRLTNGRRSESEYETLLKAESGKRKAES